MALNSFFFLCGSVALKRKKGPLALSLGGLDEIQ